MRFRALRRRWQLARVLAQAERDGKTLIAIPAWMGARARQDLWVASTQHAQEKWTARVAEVTLPEWQAAMRRVRGQDLPPPD